MNYLEPKTSKCYDITVLDTHGEEVAFFGCEGMAREQVLNQISNWNNQIENMESGYTAHLVIRTTTITRTLER